MKAWHFVGNTLRDGRPVPTDGEKLVHDGRLVMCRSGLHASKRIIDALRYAPGSKICRVDCGGEIIHQDDKLDCTERTILWRVDGKKLLQDFACRCALDVIHLWDAPDVVVRYLKTGDESLKAEAYAATWATRTAAGAAWGATEAASRAAWAAAWDACDAVWGAAWAAAWDAAAATWAAAGDAAWDAARIKQNHRLTSMVMTAYEKEQGDVDSE